MVLWSCGVHRTWLHVLGRDVAKCCLVVHDQMLGEHSDVCGLLLVLASPCVLCFTL
jgi:hypothetical protein